MPDTLTQPEMDQQAELVNACVTIAGKGWMVVNDGGRFRMVHPPQGTDPAGLPFLICAALSESDRHPSELVGDILGRALDRARRALAKLK